MPSASLALLAQCYLALVPPRQIQVPKDETVVEIHDFLLNYVLLLPHAQRYPPSQEYQYSFWKWAINLMEQMITDELDFDIDERIYDQFTSLLSASQLSGPASPTSTTPSLSWITYTWPSREHSPSELFAFEDYHTATLLESRKLIESGTTGLRTWTASLALAEYLTSHPDVICGKRTLELGSGTGFLGIAMAAIQKQHGSLGPMWLSDVHDQVLERCRANLAEPCNASSTSSSIQVTALDWTDALETGPRFEAMKSTCQDISPDVIVGADLVFDPSLIPPLVATLKFLLAPLSGDEESQVRYALIALTVRNEETFDTFTRSAQESSLLIEEVPITLEEPLFVILGNGIDSVQLMKIKLGTTR